MNNSNNSIIDRNKELQEILELYDVPMSKNKKRDFWLSPAGLECLFEIEMRFGYPDNALMKVMGISNNFFYELLKVKEFNDTLNRARRISIKAVHRTAFDRAKNKMVLKKQVVTKNGDIVTIEEEIPPSDKMIAMLLKSRMPEIYGDNAQLNIQLEEIDNSFEYVNELVLGALDHSYEDERKEEIDKIEKELEDNEAS